VPTVTSEPAWSAAAGVPTGWSAAPIEAKAAPPRSTTALDMDGDGTTDTTTGPSGGPVVVHRGDGDLTVTGIPESGISAATVSGADLDGDDRTELVVQRTAGFGLGMHLRTWIVPGTTPPGTVAVDAVGLSFDGTLSGDVTGDGLDDLALRLTMSTVVLGESWASGVEVLAALPSASPFAGLDQLLFRADLDFDGKVDGVHKGPDDRTSITLSTGTTLPLTTAADPFAVHGYRAGTRTILQVLGAADALVVQGFELHNTCAEAWMRSATNQLLGRNPTAADYVGFGPTSEPTATQRLVRTEAMVRSQSARNQQITAAYGFYLDRPADPVGRASWLTRLRNGSQTVDSMAATMLGSREFLIKRTAGDPESWVRAAFPKAVGRNPDPGGLAYWTAQASKVGPQRAAARLLASSESRRYRIRSIHDSFYVLGGPQPASVVLRGLQDYNVGGFDFFYAQLLASDGAYLLAQANNRMKLT
jgi:hypothetical protein